MKLDFKLVIVEEKPLKELWIGFLLEVEKELIFV